MRTEPAKLWISIATRAEQVELRHSEAEPEMAAAHKRKGNSVRKIRVSVGTHTSQDGPGTVLLRSFSSQQYVGLHNRFALRYGIFPLFSHVQFLCTTAENGLLARKPAPPSLRVSLMEEGPCRNGSRAYSLTVSRGFTCVGHVRSRNEDPDDDEKHERS